MFQMKNKVRYSEVDKDGVLTWPALLNYFQDCSVNHSESLDIGLDYLKERNLAWVLSSWQIRMDEIPKFGDDIVVGTWAYDFNMFYGYRNFVLDDANGKRKAVANSIWVLMDTKIRKPVLDQPEVLEAYTLEPKLDFGTKQRKIKEPKEYVEKEPVKVLSFFIDTNGHMNNEKYVFLAIDVLPKDFKFNELKVEYRREAMLNDIMYPRLTLEQDKATVAFVDEKGKAYAVLEFKS
ncbi:Acyl-ACP thioesterase [Lachnospiraceae bacterium C7]|nr:Acyl-ACP thioesterase [Lachnospiraceae bacterium C7]